MITISKQQRQHATVISILSVTIWKHFSPQSMEVRTVNEMLCTLFTITPRREACKVSSRSHTDSLNVQLVLITTLLVCSKPVPSFLSVPACICLLHPESGPLTHRCPEGNGEKGE